MARQRARALQALGQIAQQAPSGTLPTRPFTTYPGPSRSGEGLPRVAAWPASPADVEARRSATPRQPLQPKSSPYHATSGATATPMFVDRQPPGPSHPTPPFGERLAFGPAAPPRPPGLAVERGAPRDFPRNQGGPTPRGPSKAPARAAAALAVLVLVAIAVFFLTLPHAPPHPRLAGSTGKASVPATARRSPTKAPPATAASSSSSVPSTSRPAATTPTKPVPPRHAEGSSGPAPLVVTVSPSSGVAGQTVVLSGSRLFSADGVISVTFGTVQAPVRCPTETTCDVTVPTLETAGHPSTVEIVLSTQSGSSNAVAFTYR
jgi:IPT/TIG domain